MGGVMRRWLLVVVVVVVVMAPWSSWAQMPPEMEQQYTMLHDWVKKQSESAAGRWRRGGGCVNGKQKVDAALSAAEAHIVFLDVEPADNSSTSDPAVTFHSIGEAIAKIPDGNTKRHVIRIQPGAVYREKVSLGRSKPFVTLESAEPKFPAVIAWNDTAATPGKDGKPMGAEGSSTVTIESDYFIARGIVFRNDAPPPEEKRNHLGRIIGLSTGNMAPALRVVGSKATFYKCTVEGGQGALYDHRGLHYYKSCTINGTVDFIFGNARSFYEDCNIVSTFGDGLWLPEGKPPTTLQPAAAQGGGGFSFKLCTITGESFVNLGRVGWPVLYSYTDIQNDLAPLIVNGDKFEANIHLTPSFFAAFHNYGVVSPSVVQLNYTDAAPLIGTQFVSGDRWILSIPPGADYDY